MDILHHSGNLLNLWGLDRFRVLNHLFQAFQETVKLVPLPNEGG